MIVGVIGDTHLPFTHPEYLGFCAKTFTKYKVDKVIHIGDLIDHHGISFHESDPDGFSAGKEFEAVMTELEQWTKTFPEVQITLGNHDRLVERRAMQIGLSRRMISPLEDLYCLPDGWTLGEEFSVDGVLYLHGEGAGGESSRRSYMQKRGVSVVVGHTHTVAGTDIYQQQNISVFGMNVGCGINNRSYAFAYNKPTPRKPVLSCGIVVDGAYGFNVLMEE